MMNISVLPPEVQRGVLLLTPERRAMAMELRFRMGRPAMVVFSWGEEVLPGNIPVTSEILNELLNRATGFSPYALKLEETGLYLPLEGGGRMGLCGETVIREGKLCGIRQLSSISIRLARQIVGAARESAEVLTRGGQASSALIVSPPGVGKTTFLRDLVRCISQKGFRVAVVDERRELSAMTNGAAQLDLGPTTDILVGCPKVQAVPLLIRAMNPQVLAVDEISGQRELEEIQYAAFSGVAVLATAHGKNIASLMQRPLYKKLLCSGAFEWCITLTPERKPEMERVNIPC